MIFRQQVVLNSTNNNGTAGSGLVYGFGNNPKTKFSLQASFYTGGATNGSSWNPGALGTLVASGNLGVSDINLTGSNDGIVFSSQQIVDWNNNPNNPPNNPQANGDVVTMSQTGPYEAVQLNWNINWQAATTCVITIIAQADGDMDR